LLFKKGVTFISTLRIGKMIFSCYAQEYKKNKLPEKARSFSTISLNLAKWMIFFKIGCCLKRKTVKIT